MKKLLLLGTSTGSIEMLRYAKSQGAYVIVTDYLEPERSYAKLEADEFWMINTADLDALEEKCRMELVNAVFCGVSDFNIEMALKLCDRLKLPFYCDEMAFRYTINKRDFKDLCKSCEVPVAKDYYVGLNPTKQKLDEIQFPVVVKAIDLSANKGMSYCHSKDEVVEACAYARSLSKSKTVIVERMLKGTEYIAYYVMAEGKAVLLNFSTMLSQHGYPGNCYSVTTTCTDSLNKYLKEVDPYIVYALHKMGCYEGLGWIEMILDEDGHFYVLEMGYRMTGEMMAVPLKTVCGFDSFQWLLDIAMGKRHMIADLPVRQSMLPEKCGCSYILWSKKSGIVSKIEGLDKVESIPGVNIHSHLQTGKYLPQYVYLVIITFNTNSCEEMCRLINHINQTVKVYDENGENMIIYFNDFEKIYKMNEQAKREDN